jgi:diguanylate cyclase (GGDEF)-like protein
MSDVRLEEAQRQRIFDPGQDPSRAGGAVTTPLQITTSASRPIPAFPAASPGLLAAAEWLVGDGDPRATRVRNARLAALLFGLGTLYTLLVIPFVHEPRAAQFAVAVTGLITLVVILVLPWGHLPAWAGVVPAMWALLFVSVGLGGIAGALAHYSALYAMLFVYTGLTLRPGRSLCMAGLALAGLAGSALWGNQDEDVVELIVTIVATAVVGELMSLAATWHRQARAEVSLVHDSLGRLLAAQDETAAAHLVAALGGQLLDADGVVIMLAEEPGSSVLVGRGGIGRGEDLSMVRVDMAAEQSGVGCAARSGKPFFVADAATSPVLARRFVDHFGVGSILYIPLPGEGGTVGVMAVWWTKQHRNASSFSQQVLELLSTEAGLVLSRLREVRWLDAAAATDPLTGIANRRAFDAALTRLAAGGTLVLLDLDRFKAANDLHGHGAGDAVLYAFAQSLRGSVRESDLVARIGGDEFAVLTPARGQDGATAVIARLQRDWKAPHGVGFSLGSALRGADETTAELMARADEALYANKRGRRTTG